MNNKYKGLQPIMKRCNNCENLEKKDINFGYYILDNKLKKEWKPIILTWKQIMAKLCINLKDVVPYTQEERANLSIFQLAAQKNSYLTLPEIGVGKRKTKNGFLDLLLFKQSTKRYFLVEAKFKWITKGANKHTLHKKFIKASKDARNIRLNNFNKSTRIGLVFFAPYIHTKDSALSKQGLDNILLNLLREVIKLKRYCDFIAWYFPLSKRKHIGGMEIVKGKRRKNYLPGIIMIARFIK